MTTGTLSLGQRRGYGASGEIDAPLGDNCREKFLILFVEAVGDFANLQCRAISDQLITNVVDANARNIALCFISKLTNCFIARRYKKPLHIACIAVLKTYPYSIDSGQGQAIFDSDEPYKFIAQFDVAVGMHNNRLLQRASKENFERFCVGWVDKEGRQKYWRCACSICGLERGRVLCSSRFRTCVQARY